VVIEMTKAFRTNRRRRHRRSADRADKFAARVRRRPGRRAQTAKVEAAPRHFWASHGDAEEAKDW
jgi:hypothetical protein